MRALLLSALLLLPASAHGAGLGATDKLAHVGMGYVVGMVAYGLGVRWFKLTPSSSLLLALATTTLVGLGKETLDVSVGKPFDPHDLASTMVGGAAAVGTVVVFEFE